MYSFTLSYILKHRNIYCSIPYRKSFYISVFLIDCKRNILPTFFWSGTKQKFWILVLVVFVTICDVTKSGGIGPYTKLGRSKGEEGYFLKKKLGGAYFSSFIVFSLKNLKNFSIFFAKMTGCWLSSAKEVGGSPLFSNLTYLPIHCTYGTDASCMKDAYIVKWWCYRNVNWAYHELSVYFLYTGVKQNIFRSKAGKPSKIYGFDTDNYFNSHLICYST